MASESILASLRSTRSSSRPSSSSSNVTLPAVSSAATQDVFQDIVKGRKSWKTLRGGEIVWPPELEAALLEGLASYQPDDSRETRLLGRFPMRNRFISDYIFNKTGTRRTAKQVGSRLQQLRDTCGGKKLMKLLSPCRPLGRARYNNSCRSWSDSESSSDDSFSTPSTPTDASTNFSSAASSISHRTIISIDILPQGQLASSPLPTHCEWQCSADVLRPSSSPRPFHTIDPTITFVGPSAVSAQSSFTVFAEGVTVFSESMPLTATGPAPERVDGALLYSTPIVPGFWSKIAESPDPTRFTIVQDVISTSSDAQSVIFSAMFKFTYPSQTPAIYTSNSMTGYEDDKLIHDVQPSFPIDGLYALDNYSEMEPYYDFTSIQNKSSWPSRSPSEFSSELSGYQNSDDEVDGVLSPVSTCCLSTDLSHYVS
ncbi:hypothetical protein H0H93_006964 [Arthromyces matolae]|nr:hypothetical protein H0H93_006964 [Arthromyces matolae]